MTFFQVVLSVVAALLVGGLLVFLFGGRPYRALFADAHLVEFCATLERIRAAACARIDTTEALVSPESADSVRADPRNAVTSAGLRLSYSVTESSEAPGFLRHHVSLSHPAGLVAEAAARFLGGVALVHCGVPAEAATVRRSQNLVIHVMFLIAQEHQAAFAAHANPPLDIADLPALRTLAATTGHEVDFATFEVRAQEATARR